MSQALRDLGAIEFKNKVREFMIAHSPATVQNVSDEFHVSWNTAYRYLSELVMMGELKFTKTRRGLRFELQEVQA